MRTHRFALAALALPLLCTTGLAQAPGAHWTMTSTPTDPPLRRENPGAADLAHMCVFGGQSGGTGGVALNDLWRFDGTDWSLMTADEASGSPPARARAGITWNFARNRLMVFGGDDAAGTFLGDTWEWDPTTNSWADVTPVGVSPSARQSTALAYDFANAKVLLFGGVDAGGTHLDDSWHFDGVAWIPLTPASPLPDARRQHLLVERADHLDIVLAGGQNASTGTMFADTWTWNGSSWTKVPTTGAPGCLLCLAPDFQYTQSLGTGPTPAACAVTIPSTQNFLGYTLYQKAFLVDAGTFAFGGTGLATSVIGIQ